MTWKYTGTVAAEKFAFALPFADAGMSAWTCPRSGSRILPPRPWTCACAPETPGSQNTAEAPPSDVLDAATGIAASVAPSV